MNFPINKYGEIQVSQNTIQYTIPIIYTGANELDEMEKAYREKEKELKNYPLYLFADNIQIVRNRFCFTFNLEGKKAFHYIRQLRFEEQLYYFTSLIELAKSETNILWDKNNLLIDPEERSVKSFIFSFQVHPIYSVAAIDGLKEMILFSLTTLNKVIGKPQRIDFIDQREDVIRFAELILQAKEIKEIEKIVDAAIYKAERELEIEREQEEKLKSMSLLSRIKEKKKALSKEGDLYKIQGHLQNEDKKTETFLNSKYFYIGSAAVALIILISNAIGVFDNPSKHVAAEPKAEIQHEQEEKVKEITPSELAEIYRKAIIGEEAEALKELEIYGYDNLSKQDKIAMLKLYEKIGQYEKIIRLAPEHTEDIVNKLISENNMEVLMTLKNIEHPLISFEVAYIENDWEKVIQLKDDVEKTDRRQQQIVTAYLQLGQLDAAQEFAQGNPELEKIIQDFQEQKQMQEKGEVKKK